MAAGELWQRAAVVAGQAHRLPNYGANLAGGAPALQFWTLVPGRGHRPRQQLERDLVARDLVPPERIHRGAVLNLEPVSREDQQVAELAREISPASRPERVPTFVECKERSLHARRWDHGNALPVLRDAHLHPPRLDRAQETEM